MSADVVRQYLTGVTQSGSIDNATASTTSAANTNSKITVAAGATGNYLVIPGATQSAATATVPAQPALMTTAGWRMDTDLNSTERVGFLAGQTWAAAITLASSASLTLNVTVTAFLDGTEVARGSSTAAAVTTATQQTLTMTSIANVSAAAAARLQFNCYVIVSGLNLNILSSTTVTVSLGGTSSYVDPTYYYVAYDRTSSNTLPSAADASSRTSAVGRSGSDALTLPTAAGQRAITANRQPSESLTQAASTVFTATYPRISADATPSSLDSVLSVQADFRRASDLSNLATDDTARRVVTSRRALVDSMMTTDSALKLVIYGRTARYDFVPGDQPLIDPTRQVTGVIRNGDGTPYLGSATVYLVRDDNLVVASTLSSAADGSYNFLRNSYDTSTYYVVAFTDGSLPQEGVTERGLVPS